MKQKVVSIIGTRPNYIKIAAIHPLLKKIANHVIIDTGQHYDYQMAKIFYSEFMIPNPQYNLSVRSDDPTSQVAKMMLAIGPILKKEKPNLILVYGDTNSTLAGTLAGAMFNVTVGHIEAGVRSFDRTTPEEKNRLVVDELSDLLFCPTQTAANNLRQESNNVFMTGDIMYDIFLTAKPSVDILNKLKLTAKNYYYCTIHRQENTQNTKRLSSIFNQLPRLDKVTVLPVHPRTKKALVRLKIPLKNIKLIQPVGHAHNLTLIQNSLFVITDSGGVQKEAYWSSIPCLTLRNSTEWPETLDHKWNQLTNPQKANILDKIKHFKKPKGQKNFFGDGHAAAKIVSIVRNSLDS